VLHHQRPELVDAVVTDCVGDFAGKYQPRPAGQAVASRENELRVDKRYVGGVRSLRVVLLKIRQRIGIAAPDRAE
jgi:hypothetical protein